MRNPRNPRHHASNNIYYSVITGAGLESLSSDLIRFPEPIERGNSKYRRLEFYTMVPLFQLLTLVESTGEFHFQLMMRNTLCNQVCIMPQGIARIARYKTEVGKEFNGKAPGSSGSIPVTRVSLLINTTKCPYRPYPEANSNEQ